MALKRKFIEISSNGLEVDQVILNKRTIETVISHTKSKIIEKIKIENNNNNLSNILEQEFDTLLNQLIEQKEEVQYVSKKSRDNNSDSNIELYSPSLGYFQGLPQPILEIIFDFIKNNNDSYYYNPSFASLRLTCKSFQKLVLPFWHQTIPISNFDFYLKQIEKNQTIFYPSISLANNLDKLNFKFIMDIFRKLENLPTTSLNLGFGFTNDILNELLLPASREGLAKIVDLLLGTGINPDEIDYNDNTSLMLAISRNDIKIVKLLLQYDANPNQSSGEGYPLFKACQQGYTEIVRLLLKNEADPNKPNLGQLPLYIACQNGYTEIVKLLLENDADPNKPNNDGVTPLSVASQIGNVEIIDLLRQKL